MTQLTPAQQKQLDALNSDFVSMKHLRKERKGANIKVLRKLLEKNLVEVKDPHHGTDCFICEDLQWRSK